MPPGERLLEYITYTRAQLSFLSISDRVVTNDADSTSHLAATLPQEIPGNVPWFMTDSIAVFEDGYSEVFVNIMALELKCSMNHGNETKLFEGAYNRD